MSNLFSRPPVTPVPSESEVTTAVRAAIADGAETDSLIEDAPQVDVIEPEDDRFSGYKKLSSLIEGDFPFDESQLDAIDGLASEPYACLTGAAGTGKTTTTKAVVDKLLKTQILSAVDMNGYWKKGTRGADPDDEYEMPDGRIPAVAMCSFTGRATQMIKKNFPRDWHGNIMTIHRMLGFVPEYYEDWDEESQEYRNKMRFTPTYNSMFKLPWDIIIIDEAGMLGLDLWHQLLDATKDGCRIIMIGDINQLPPVHGKSVFGFAMANWPSWELTHVHRQQGENNEIVDNAWRIIHGQRPQHGGRFLMVPLKGDAQFSSRQVRAMLPKMKEMGAYDPDRDVTITPINGEEGSRGFALGQLPLNRELSLIFNPCPEGSNHPRYMIDGGRERKQFAVGDKVMATRNDWEAGITNGMTGIISEISENAEYAGDRRRFGTVAEVNAYFAEHAEEAEHVELDLDALNDSMEAMDRGKEKSKEKKERGPASHIVTVRFGEGEHSFEIPFGSLAEVGSLMTAYVVTCHKMQGGEAPVVVILLHEAHRAMLYREWLYTAVTRASQKCILLYKEDALRTALNKQKMKGTTLKQKILSFAEQQGISEESLFGPQKIAQLPVSHSTRNRILDREDTASTTPARLTTDAERSGGLASLLAKKQKPNEGAEPQVAKVVVEVVHRTVHERVERVNITPSPDTQERRPVVDGGDVTPERKSPPEDTKESPTPIEPPVPQLPPPPVAVSQPWAAHYLVNLAQDIENAQRLLPHIKIENPTPTVKAPVRNPFARRA